MDFLRTGEKIKLCCALADEGQLRGLSLSDAENMVGRPIRQDKWLPELFLAEAERDRSYLLRAKARFVSIFDPDYPPQLRETYHPPFGLFVRGSLPRQDTPVVAMVGTRIASARGINAAATLAKELSQAGIPIVSGLARGIDSASHRGSLAGKTAGTIAVLPRGIETIYPSSNKPLAASILDNGGAVVTEYPPFCTLNKYHFPERNRIIAGLARSTVVVEAPEKSGALITAEFALSEGRDVYVHAACLGKPRNEGADALVLQGAKPVQSAAEIFADWGWQCVNVTMSEPVPLEMGNKGSI
jgi:DNA processing protein